MNNEDQQCLTAYTFVTIYRSLHLVFNVIFTFPNVPKLYKNTSSCTSTWFVLFEQGNTFKYIYLVSSFSIKQYNCVSHSKNRISHFSHV